MWYGISLFRLFASQIHQTFYTELVVPMFLLAAEFDRRTEPLGATNNWIHFD